MKTEHQTLILVLQDGSHRVVTRPTALKWQAVKQEMCSWSETLDKKVVGVVLITGTDINEYTANEFIEFTTGA